MAREASSPPAAARIFLGKYELCASLGQGGMADVFLAVASFGHGVNVTLGLPFVRTSVDHGTALDLAGDAALARTVDPGSLFAAVDLAIALARAKAEGAA